MVLSLSTTAARKSYGQIADKLEVGNLIQTQLDSFEWFKREGLRELFDEINPITDYTGKNYELDSSTTSSVSRSTTRRIAASAT